MKEELENKGSSVLVPFLVGGLVGAGVALLLAPKSGQEIRKDIKDIAARTTDTISGTFEKGKEVYVENKAAIVDAIDAGKNAFLQERDKHRRAA